MSNSYIIAAIILMTVITFALRALPFMAGRWLNQHTFVQQLGDTLPLAIMVLLTVDTAVGQSAGNAHGIWQESLAVLVVVILQWRLRIPLLSILAGTALYV